MLSRLAFPCLLLVCGLVLAACGSSFPKPNEVVPPSPITDNSGEFMSPYLANGTQAPWVDSLAAGEKLGKFANREAGRAGGRLFGAVGAISAGVAGDAIEERVRQSALEDLGGEEGLRKHSDLSFNTIDDMIVWLYAVHSHDGDFDRAKRMASYVYPSLESRWRGAIENAPRR